MRLLGGFYLVMLAGVVLLANSGERWILHWVNYIPMRDKAGHFLLLGTACLAVNLLLVGRKVSVREWHIYLGTLLLLVVATLEEISQLWLVHRTFSYSDFLANWLGILCFDRLYAFLEKRREQAQVPAAVAAAKERT